MARTGLNPLSRRAMLDMRARYSKDITPIEQAWTERDRQMKVQQEMMLKDPTHMYRTQASQVGLREFMSNPSYDTLTDNYSGALLTQQVGNAAAQLKNALTDKGSLQKLGLPYQYERMLQHGYTPEQVMQAMTKDPQAAPILNKIVDDVMASSGIRDWGDEEISTKAEAYARQGLYNAIGQPKIDNFTDSFSMQDALNARQHARTVAAQKAAEAQANRVSKGNIPIDIHHLISPNQEGDSGAKIVSDLSRRLGFNSALNGRYSKQVNLGSLVVGRSDVLIHRFKNKDGGTTVKIFNNNHELMARDAVVKQGKTKADQAALGRWYDQTYKTITENLTPNAKGHWDVLSMTNQMRSINSGKGALTMGAMRVNFGADNNEKVLKSLLPGVTSGDNTAIYEITSFTRDGKMNRGKRAALKDFQDKKGNILGTPMFYAAPNANTDGLIMKYNGKTYLIPRDKLGSLGEQVYNINIPALQNANAMKQDLISRYGESAYYGSEEGNKLEQILDNYGAAYLRAAGTALGYSYALPNYNIKETSNN